MSFRQLWLKNTQNKSGQTALKLFTKFGQGNFRRVGKQCFDLIIINFYNPNPWQTVSQWYKISCICTDIHQLKGLRLLFVSNNKDIAFIKDV
jgi:hypothetical protein